MKNKFELIDYFMIFAIAFFILIGTMSTMAQSYTVTKCEMHDHYVIRFIDEFNDRWYADGEEVVSYGKLDLTKKEYVQLIKDIKKTFLHGHSFTANHIACSAALTSIELFEKEQNLEKVEKISLIHH